MEKPPMILRGRIWYLDRRVPVRYASVEPAVRVTLTMGTRNHAEASAKSERVWAELVAAWELRLAGPDADAMKRHDAAREIAAKKGFTFISLDEVRELAVESILERVEAIPKPLGKPQKEEGAALLGTAQKPRYRISNILDDYFKLIRSEYIGKDEQQVKKKKNPVYQANRDFIDAVGDVYLDELTRDHILDYREWWLEKLEAGKVVAKTINKNIDQFKMVIRVLNDEKRLGIKYHELGIRRLNEGEKNTRPPFSTKWIREKLLAPGAFDGLNDEATAIFMLMLNTGARPSELRALSKNTIVLQSNVPHISIEPEGRKLKTYNSRRKIPLVGVSLEVARKYPDGFPTYRKKDNISKHVNDYLTKAGLRETDKHVMYSLRHSFEDRMKAADIDHEARVILPVLTGCRSRLQAAIFSFWAGVMPPMPMLGRSLL